MHAGLINRAIGQSIESFFNIIFLLLLVFRLGLVFGIFQGVAMLQ